MQNHNSKSKIIFFGSSKHVIPIIKALQKNFDLKLVLTTEKNLTDEIPMHCIKSKISYLSVSSLVKTSVMSRLSLIAAPVAVLADFGLIIPKQILNCFPKGIINIHPSLLPKYRGPTPVQTAILNGEKITGVSIMKVDEKIDHGPILEIEKEEILDIDTSESLYKRLFEKGAKLLPKVINFYLKGNLKLIAQNHKEATFTKPLTRQNGYVKISNLTCPQRGKSQISNLKLKRMIRAYYPWPGVWFKAKLNGVEKIIKLLPEQKFQVEGKKSVDYKDFLNGYPKDKKLLKNIY